MKGYEAISALDVFKFRLSLDKGERIEANQAAMNEQRNKSWSSHMHGWRSCWKTCFVFKVNRIIDYSMRYYGESRWEI
jgi:hypothetical protein